MHCSFPPMSRTLLSLLLAASVGVTADPIVPMGVAAETRPERPVRPSLSDAASLRAAYDASRHSAIAVEGGHRARNPRQQWTTHFDGLGFTTAPDAGGWTWGLELLRFGAGDDLRSATKPGAVRAEGPRVSYDWDTVLTEWYVNDRRGLEHGFTVRSRPVSGEGALTLDLGIRGGLVARVSDDGRDVRFADGGGAPSVNYLGLTVLDADRRPLPARFETHGAGLRLRVDDAGARYPIVIDPIAQQAYLKASNTDASDSFAFSIAASGNTVVVGAPYEDSNATTVDGNGSDNSASIAGAAYVFVRNGATWSQQAYLKPSNADAGDNFGYAVAISGDTIVVGSPFEQSNATGVNGDPSNDAMPGAGAAYVFVRSGTTWSQQAYLKAPNTQVNDVFGIAVAVSGDTAVVGAHGEDSNATGVNGDPFNNLAAGAGAAFVFVRNGGSWGQQAYLKASNTGFSDTFGESVAISGDTIAVGAYSEDSSATGVDGNQLNDDAQGSGAAYVFVRSGLAWSQQAYLKASNTGPGDQFGRTIAISGDTVVVGAWSEASNATGVNGNQSSNISALAGAAYVFARNGSTWSQQAYLKASNTGPNDQFGFSVAVSGNSIVVGANLEDSSATGVNGPNNNTASASGAAYTFLRTGATWSPQAYLKASNTGANDQFGASVAISGDLVVVGARHETSSASGVNANQADNSAVQAGAAYAFDLDNDPGTASYGTGSPGCAGTQTLGVNQAPMLGSLGFAITCDNAPPSSLGLGLVSDSQDLLGSDPFGLGVLLHVDLLTAVEVLGFDFVSDPAGNAVTLGTGIANYPPLVGKTYYAMALWAWSSCSLPPYDLSTSRGLAITILIP